MKLSQTDIERICFPFLKDIETNHFQVYLTVGGNVCIILNRQASEEYPLLGAYFTESNPETGQWMPARWSAEGMHNKANPSKLDLRIPTSTENEAA